MTRRPWLPVALAGLTMTLTACPGGLSPTQPGSADTVPLGFIAPLSGNDASVGAGTLNGAQLAIEHINAAGGVNGKKVSLIRRDDTGEAARGAEVAADLVKQKVAAIIGPTWSGVTKQVVESVTKAAGIPNVSPGATSPLLATFDDGGYFFRTIPNDTLQGKAMSKLVQEDGHKSVVVLARDNAYGNGFADALVADIKAAGGTAVKITHADNDQPNFQAIQAKIPAGVTAVCLVGYVGDGSSIFRDWIATSQHADWKWYFGESIRDASFAKNVANNARLEGMKGTQPQPDGPYKADFVTAYKAKYGIEPGIYDGFAYDATMLVALAMVRGKANTPDAVKANLVAVSSQGQKQSGFGRAGFTDAVAKLSAAGDVDYDGVSGSVDMDANGEMKGGNYVIWNWQGGNPVDTAKVFRF
jgi:ABC-type branched-subunit amino acid transport system substrate-binding protein